MTHNTPKRLVSNLLSWNCSYGSGEPLSDAKALHFSLCGGRETIEVERWKDETQTRTKWLDHGHPGASNEWAQNSLLTRCLVPSAVQGEWTRMGAPAFE